MLTVTMSIGPNSQHPQRTVAKAVVANVSELADISDYLVVEQTNYGPPHAFVIRGHRRDNGPWELLRRIVDAHAAPDSHAKLPNDLEELAERLACEL